MVFVEAHLQGLGVTCLLERDRRNDRDERVVQVGSSFRPNRKKPRKSVKKVR